MTIKSARAWLMRYRYACDRIAAQVSKIEQLYTIATSCSLDPSQEKIHHSNTGDTLERAVCSIVCLKDEIAAEQLDAARIRCEIETAIDTLPDMQRRLIKHRYIDGLDWHQIETILKINRNKMFYIERAALKKLIKKI